MVELKPEAVAAFVAQHAYAVVQATLPETACKCCVGADKVFDASAAQKHSLPQVFAGVHWPPWNKTPDFGSVLKVNGIPTQIVFIQGKKTGSVDGRPANAALLAQGLVSVAKDNGALGHTVKANPQLADGARLGPRGGYGPDALVGARSVYGARRHRVRQDVPNSKDRWAGTYRQWQTSHTTSRDAAANQCLKYIMRNNRTPMDDAMRLEKSALQRLITQEVGLDWKKSPNEAQFGQVVERLSKLPVP